MEIVPLDESLEPIFWEIVKKDIPHYYFFAFDWKYNRDETKILLALEGNRVEGMMLTYKQRAVHIRGSCEAAKAFLGKLDLEEVELQALMRHKRYVLEKYEPTVTHKINLMILRKGEERLQLKNLVVKLDTSDAEHISTIMKDADPEFWGTTTSQQIAERMSRVNWFGIKVNGELVSIGNTHLTDWIGLIGVLATRETHRNKGYATSIVSALVKQIFEKLSKAMICVLSDNTPAIRVYEKVGFKQYRTYFFVRGKKR